MRAGSYQVVESVGNPPVVSAIANGTDLKVVWIESYDGAGLYVNTNKIHSIAELRGRDIGVLTGSTLAWELTGWLNYKHISAHIVQFGTEGAILSAFLVGKLDAMYVDWTFGTTAAKKPGTKQWVTAAQIAKLGYPALNVIAMPSSFISKYPALTQKIVCTVVDASKLLLGPKRDTYIAAAANLVGQTKEVAIAGSHNFPLLSLSQQKLWFGKPGTPAIKSPIVKTAYARAGMYLKSLGVIKHLPPASQLAAAIEPRFAVAAARGGCG